MGEERIKHQPELIRFQFKILEEAEELYSEKDIDSPYYPSDLTLCEFANIIYQNIDILPTGWKLVATGENQKDGYFGAAFWHGKHKQLVICHGGQANLKSLKADFEAIIKHQRTSSIDSACSFTFTILKKISSDRFSISITGHSLGGWLAQITGFAVQYLQVEGDILRRSQDKKHHPHIVTFDAPGSYDMLSRLCKDYFRDHEISPNDLVSFLDITNYLMNPITINTKNRHAGKTLCFNHKKQNALGLLGHDYVARNTCTPDVFRELEQGSSEIFVLKILDQPTLSTSNVKHGFYSYSENSGGGNISLNIEKYDRTTADIKIFQENELMFLNLWKKYQNTEEQNEKEAYSDIITFFKDKKIRIFTDFYPNFDIFDDRITCKDDQQLSIIINRTKKLFQIFPELDGKMKGLNLPMPETYEIMLKNATDRYIKDFPKDDIDLDILNVKEFLESERKMMILVSEKPIEEAFIVYSALKKFEKKFYILNSTDIELLGFNVDIIKILNSASDSDVFLIHFGSRVKDDPVRLCQKLSEGTSKKICLVSEKIEVWSEKIQIKIVEDIYLKNLSKDLQNAVLKKKIILTRKEDLSLESFQDEHYFNENLSFNILKKYFLKRENEMIDIRFIKGRYNFAYKDNYMKWRFKHIDRTFYSRFTLNFQNLSDLFPRNDSTAVFIWVTRSKFLIKYLTERHSSDRFIFCDSLFGAQLLFEEKSADPKIGSAYLIIAYGDEKEHIKLILESIGGSKEQISHLPKANFDITENILIKKEEKVIIISDESGTGKSTTMLNIADTIKESWIIWINLVDACQYVDILSTINLDSAVNFLLHFAEDSSELSIILLKHFLSQEKSFLVNLFFDGYNEIYSCGNKEGMSRADVQKKILDLLSFLKNETKAKIWISTRPNENLVLEEKLGFASTLKFQDQDQEKIQFAEKFWSLQKIFKKNPTLDIHLYEQFEMFYKPYVKNQMTFLIGIPLQFRIVGELLHPETALSAIKSTLHLRDLYSCWITLKVEDYLKKKLTDQLSISFIQILCDSLLEKHQILGMKHLFPDLIQYLSIDISKTEVAEINKVGLVRVKKEVIEFSHETLAYYFAAEMCSHLIENRIENEFIQKFIIENIFFDPNSKIIRYFLDKMLETKRTEIKVFKYFPEIWKKYHDEFVKNKKDEDGKVFILHRFVEENNVTLTSIIAASFKHNFLEKKFINFKNYNDMTAFQTAQRLHRADIFSKYFTIEEYSMDHRNRGTALIFRNLVDFEHIALRSRSFHGLRDVSKIVQELVELGFTVHEFKELKVAEIIARLQEAAKNDYSDSDCLVVIVLSHGVLHELHARDANYRGTIFWDSFSEEKTPTLRGKPKLFLFQTCQNPHTDIVSLSSKSQLNVKQREIEDYKLKYPTSDMLIVYALVPECIGYRTPISDSYSYISKFWETAKESGAKYEIQHILRLVNESISYDFSKAFTNINPLIASKSQSEIAADIQVDEIGPKTDLTFDIMPYKASDAMEDLAFTKVNFPKFSGKKVPVQLYIHSTLTKQLYFTPK